MDCKKTKIYMKNISIYVCIYYVHWALEERVLNIDPRIMECSLTVEKALLLISTVDLVTMAGLQCIEGHDDITLMVVAVETERDWFGSNLYNEPPTWPLCLPLMCVGFCCFHPGKW